MDTQVDFYDYKDCEMNSDMKLFINNSFDSENMIFLENVVEQDDEFYNCNSSTVDENPHLDYDESEAESQDDNQKINTDLACSKEECLFIIRYYLYACCAIFLSQR